MKNLSKAIIVLAASTALTASASYATPGGTGTGGGGGAPSVLATANATVVAPVLVTESTQLNFGTFAPNPGGTGTIDTSGNVTGGVNVITAGTPGIFAVSGQANNSYSIQGDNAVTLKGATNANNTMTAALTYPVSPRTLTNGSDTFNVTGTLNVGAAQVADTYTGQYNVAVHY